MYLNQGFILEILGFVFHKYNSATPFQSILILLIAHNLICIYSKSKSKTIIMHDSYNQVTFAWMYNSILPLGEAWGGSGEFSTS